MTAEEWLARFAEELGGEPPDRREVARLLKLASVAAHSSERKAAPIACWIAARAGMPLEDALEIAKRVGES